MATPSLNLGNGNWAIKESNLLGYTVSGSNYIADEFVFTRATSGTTTNSLGIIEDSCYNIFQRSEEFNDIAWGKSGINVSANAILAPNGTVTAEKIVTDNSNAQHFIYQPLANPNISYNIVFSVYAKAAEFYKLALYSTGYIANFDLSNGTVEFDGIIQSIGNGWYKCSLLAPIGAVDPNYIIFLLNNAGASNYLGDNVSGLYIWGAQVTYGTSVRPYLKTTNRLNIPRIDYSKNVSGSLLVEPQRTNLLLQSGNLLDSNWVGIDTVITSNNNLNPFGLNKSFYLIDNNVNSTHFLYQLLSYTPGTTYTDSWYVKKADDTWVQFLKTAALDTDCWTNFNFDTGTFGNHGTQGSWSSRQLINGYWLITLTKDAIQTSAQGAGMIFGTNNTNTINRGLSYIGTGRKICDVAAIQTEIGPNATSYIPTTTATVTRNEENTNVAIQINKQFNPNNFTLFVEGFLYNGFNGSYMLGFTDQVGNIIGVSWGISPAYTISSVTTTNVNNLPANSIFKLIIQYNNGVLSFFRNGIQIWANISYPIINHNLVVINNGGSTYSVKKLELYTTTLTDAECVLLTTL